MTPAFGYDAPPLSARGTSTLLNNVLLSTHYLRFQISPEMSIALRTTVMAPGEQMIGEIVEIVASRHPRPGEMEAYERVLGDAMAGDATLFAREDYVEETWRIVDPVLKGDTAIYEYEQGAWGPREVDLRLTPLGGGHNPAAGEQEDFRVAAQAGGPPLERRSPPPSEARGLEVNHGSKFGGGMLRFG